MLSAFPLRAVSARWLSRYGLILALALATSTCAAPTDAPDPPEENPPAPFEGSLDLNGPTTLQVNQAELFTVTARDADGKTVSPWPVGFKSSDQSVAVVSASGVVTARSRGTAIISAARGSAADSVTVDVEARLARRLLMTHDRAHSDHFYMTHQFLANMLGVLRSAVTIAAYSLQQRGLIHYNRGEMHISDRAGLEASACVCYALGLEDYKKLFIQ